MHIDTLRNAAIEYAALPTSEARETSTLRRLVSGVEQPPADLYLMAEQVTGKPVDLTNLVDGRHPEMWAARLRTHLCRWAVKNRPQPVEVPPNLVEVTMTFTAELADAPHTFGYDHHALADVVRFNVGLSDLDSMEVDMSAFKMRTAVEARGIRPGDMVERLGFDLDDREVVSVGRDFLTLDFNGTESVRVPLDNYRTTVPADGSL